MTSGLFKPYFLAILFLGMASGTALNLVVFTIPYQLSEVGYPTHTIGAIFLTGLPYCLKPIWAPFIDRYSIPYLCKRFGQRRGWALATQLALTLSVSSLLIIDPAVNIYITAAAAFSIAFFAAMTDIILDAYRIERSETPELLSAATTFSVIGMRLGMLVSSAGSLFISYSLDWYCVYIAAFFITLVGPIVICSVTEPLSQIRHVTDHHLSLKQYFGALKESVTRLKLSQPKLPMIMLLVLLYKVNDSVPMAMSSPFFMELNFSSFEIASIFKGYGFFVMIFGCMIGGFLSSKIGITKSLLVCGIFQILSPVMFAILSLLGHNYIIFIATITVQNFVSGLAVTALSIYLSGLCNSKLVATQFSIIYAFNSLSRIILSSSSGVAAAYLGWTEFFCFTAILGSMFVLVYHIIYK